MAVQQASCSDLHVSLRAIRAVFASRHSNQAAAATHAAGSSNGQAMFFGCARTRRARSRAQRRRQARWLANTAGKTDLCAGGHQCFDAVEVPRPRRQVQCGAALHTVAGQWGTVKPRSSCAVIAIGLKPQNHRKNCLTHRSPCSSSRTLQQLPPAGRAAPGWRPPQSGRSGMPRRRCVPRCVVGTPWLALARGEAGRAAAAAGGGGCRGGCWVAGLVTSLLDRLPDSAGGTAGRCRAWQRADGVRPARKERRWGPAFADRQDRATKAHEGCCTPCFMRMGRRPGRKLTTCPRLAPLPLLYASARGLP